MAFKMKGHELPGPNQRKGSPVKWVQFALLAASMLGSAVSKMGSKQKEADMAKLDARAEERKLKRELAEQYPMSTQESRTGQA